MKFPAAIFHFWYQDCDYGAEFCSHIAQLDLSPAQLVVEQKLQLLKIFPIQVLI